MPATDPPDDTSLHDVLARLEREGFVGQFRPGPAARIHCFSCGRDFAADQVSADSVSRLEGQSDPADMMIVIPLQCPHCEVRGTLVASYGPESTVEEVEVVTALHRTPHEAELGVLGVPAPSDPMSSPSS
jgi:hypothetical protein